MGNIIKTFCLAALLAAATAPSVFAHCQVPCGIFDDNNMIESMHIDYVTIEKASSQIVELSKDDAANANQLVRWVTNKESHAQHLQEKVLNYFLAQRLKTDDPEYVEKLKLCHSVIIAAMKCKQATDAATVKSLHDALDAFDKAFTVKE